MPAGGDRSGLRTVLTLCLGGGLGLLLELGGELDIIEEDVRVVEFAVPGALQIVHGLQELVQFFVADKGDKGGVGAGRVLAVGRVVMLVGSP